MIEKLEFIIALARERHFGHAAEACGVSQPTLSAGIKQLEDSFGVLLVQRGSRFQGFTPEGERVLDWARRIVGDTRAMRQEIDALKQGLAGHIRIAAIPTALAMVAMITTPYPRAASRCPLHHSSRNSIEVLGLLGKSGGRCGPDLSRQRALGPGADGAALQRAIPAARLVGQPARQPRQGDLGRSRQGAALPADPRHAEPPHHRAIAAAGGRRSVAPTLESNSIVVLFAHVRTGSWASVMPAKLAEVLGLDREGPRHPDRRARSHAFDRAGRAPSQPVDAADQCAGQRSARTCADLGGKPTGGLAPSVRERPLQADFGPVEDAARERRLPDFSPCPRLAGRCQGDQDFRSGHGLLC